MGVIKISRSLALILVAGFIILYPPAQAIELPEQAVSVKILGNGLSVLASRTEAEGLVAIHAAVKAAPISEGEYVGSGISHLVEHMLFKGTDTRRPGDIERMIKSLGGIANGAVSQDQTYYEVVVPSENLREALSLLRDMLSNASFDPAEIKKEKEVILKEIRLTRDNPERRIMRLLNERAYLRHPYKYPAIGYEDNFSVLTRDDLVRYYNMMYVPNRITITIVGDIDAAEAVSSVEEEFNNFRSSDYATRDSTVVEPPQISARLYREDFTTSLSYLSMAFHSTSLVDKDLYAMDVLAIILGTGDASRLNISLYKQKRLVHTVSCWNYTPEDPGLFIVSLVADKDKIEGARDAVLDEVRKIRDGFVSDEELEGARRIVLSGLIQSLETIDQRARSLSTGYILTGSEDFSAQYLRGIQGVSREDIKRVANHYLRPENATIVILEPPTTAKPLPSKASAGHAENIIFKEKLPNGMRLLLRENRALPAIAITVAMEGGLMAEDASDNGISNLTAAMLLKGTGTRREDAIKGFVDNLGGDISSFSGMNSFGINMFILKPDLKTGLEILKDVLSDPVFPEEEIEKLVSLIIASISNEDDDIFSRGFNAMRKELFGDSPYSMRYAGERSSLVKLKREDLIRFYRTYCVAENMVISISGDIETAPLAKRIKELFADIRRGGGEIDIPSPDKIDSVRSAAINMERLQSLLVFGFRTTTVDDPDRYALEVLGSILSGSSGRMFDKMRDKDPLAYTLGCAQKIGLGTGYMAFYVATTRDNIPRARKLLTAEIERIKKNDADDEELTLAKRELDTSRRSDMQSNDFFAMTTALDELYGLGHDNIYKYYERIDRVSKKDIRRVANIYLDTKACAEITITGDARL